MATVPAAFAAVLYRGTNYRLRFTLTETTDENGDAINVSAWTTKFTLRTAPTAASVTLQKSGVVDDAALCRFYVSITRVEMLAIVAGEYFGSFVRTNAGTEDPLAVPIDPTKANVSVRHNIYDAPA